MNCLFVQWKKPTDPSKFVINGLVSEYNGSEEQNRIIQLMADVSKFKEVYRNNNGDNAFSPSFRCSYHRTRESFLSFVEGNFIETDCAGRKLVYIFGSSEKSSANVADKLVEYANIIGLTPYKADIDAIKAQNFKKKSQIVP